MTYRFKMNNQHTYKRKVLQETILLCIIAVIGLLYVRYTYIRFENEQNGKVLQVARSIVATLSKEDLKALRALPGDTSKPQYHVIKDALKAIIHVNTKARFAYLYTEKNGKIYFMVDSEQEDSKDYSPPGQEYTEANAIDKQPFRNGKELITPSLSDRWGTWRSVFIPITDEVNGNIIAVFGMDFNSKSWNYFLLYEVIESSVLIALLLLTLIFLFKIKAKNNLLRYDISMRKRVELALGESELRYQTLAQISPVGIFHTDAQGVTTYVNPKWCQISGLSADDALGNGWLRSVHPDDREKLNTNWIASTQQRSASSAEYRFIRPDGSVAWVLGQAVQEKDANDELVGYVGTITDITESTLVEEAMRESERSKSVLLSNLPGIAYRCRFDHYWTMEFVSEGCYNLTGYEKEAITHNRDISFNDLILPEYREHLWKVWKEAVALHGTICEEYRIRTADNLEKWVWEQGNPVYNKTGEIEALEGLIIDITGRKLAEQELLKGKQQYENLVSNIPVGIYILHTKPEETFVLDYVSQRVAEMLDISVENMLADGKKFFHSIHPDDLDGFTKLNQDGIQYKKPFNWKGRFLVAGKVKWLHFVSTPEPLENGDFLWNGLITDITEGILAQEEINHLNAELEQRVQQRTLQLENTNKELEAFSYSVSHDLRAPLRGIDGWSLALLEDYNDVLDDKGRIYLERVRRESQRMGDLIDDLLKLSRVNRLDMNKMQVDISGIAQTITDRLRESNAVHRCTFIIEPGLFVQGDPHMLEIALTNLLDNAFKFTGTKESAKIEFGLMHMNGFPTFYVRDNGVGFDMEYARKLFGAFQRMHKQSEFPGSGLGLATVKRIISRHGGRIWAESKRGEGATFYFTLSYNAEVRN